MINQTTDNFLAGAIIGSVVGAAAALLLAPIPGRKFRQQLQDGVKILRKKTSNLRHKTHRNSKPKMIRRKARSSARHVAHH